MRVRWLFQLALATAIAGCAQHNDSPKTTAFEAPPLTAHPEWPEPKYRCTSHEAIDVTFRAFKTEPTRYFGKCIHIIGFADQKYLYENIDGFNKVQNLPFGVSPYMHIIGFYLPKDPDHPDTGLEVSRSEIDAIALAYTCEEVNRRAFSDAEAFNAEQHRLHGDDVETVRIPFVGGFCHYTNDSVLFISQYRVLSREPQASH